MNVSQINRRNIRLLYGEMVFASIMAGIAAFGPALAIRLGASGTAIALLSALPALMGAVVGIPSGWFLTRRRQRKWWFLGSLMLSRLGYLIVAVIPLLVHVAAGYWVVATLIAFGLPLAFFQSGWNGFLADILPLNKRVEVLSWRNVIFAVGLAAGSSLGGLWLVQLPFPLNYSLLYASGFLVTLGSDYLVARLIVPISARSLPAAHVSGTTLTAPARGMLINVFTWNLTWTFAVPLFPLYFIHVLGWSDVWIGAFGAASGLGVVLGCILSARLVRENSPMGIIRPAATLTGLLPLLLMASSASSLIVLTAFVVNAAWACVDLLTLTTTLELSPEGKRMAHVGWYMAALSAGSFVGPLLGVAVVARLDYTVAFMVAAILRFGAAGLFWLDGLKFFTWRRVLGQMALWAIAPVVIGLVCILVLISYGLDKGASLWR